MFQLPIIYGNINPALFKKHIHVSSFSKTGILTDENVAFHWNKKLRSLVPNTELIVINAGEENKTLATAEKIWSILLRKGFDRHSLLINAGGGMVCDIGAFAACIYMRGIHYINMPTTLLAQADAAIGGKGGVNFKGLKNMLGIFSAPLAVFSDISFLKTLPEREYKSGFAEIIKHAIIADRKLFELVLNSNLSALNYEQQKYILSQSCAIKLEITGKDPLEKKERKKLNFGHTVAHALELDERKGKSSLLHGEAVALGMIAEAKMAHLSGSLPTNDFDKIILIIRHAGLKIKTKDNLKRILKRIVFDKKNKSGRLLWALPGKIGQVKMVSDLPDEIIKIGIKYILK